MKKIGIYYASDTGVTEDIALQIAQMLNINSADIYDVYKADASTAAQYDLLLLGSSTWEEGEIHINWVKFLPKIKPYLQGKEVALFGAGNSQAYPYSFADALGALYDELSDSGCTFVGSMPKEEYHFKDSIAVRNGRFVGCPLDEIYESERTTDRLKSWIDSF